MNSGLGSSPSETEMQGLGVPGAQEQSWCVKKTLPGMVYSSICIGNIMLIAGLGFGQLMSKESSIDWDVNYLIFFNLISSNPLGQWD